MNGKTCQVERDLELVTQLQFQTAGFGGKLRQKATDALFYKSGKQSPEVTTTFAKVTLIICAGDWDQTWVA